MLARFRARLTYSNVVSTLALFIALGGSAYAVGEITSRDIRNRSIKGGDLRLNTVTGKEIRESRLGAVPRSLQADNAATADVSKSSETANTAGSAGTAGLADVARDAQSLAGQGVGAFERSTRTQFGRASVDPAGESGETVLFSWPELGAQVASATDQASCGGALRISVRSTKPSGNLNILQIGPNAVAPPGGKAYLCAGGGDETLNAEVTDASGRALFVNCLTEGTQVRCIGIRSEP